jgi:hypothetical protein
MERPSAVFIPQPAGGNCVYQVAATSSFDAARQAIAEHEKYHPRLSDDAVVHVVVNGKGPAAFDYLEHNARQPNYRHRVGVLRQPRPARDRKGIPGWETGGGGNASERSGYFPPKRIVIPPIAVKGYPGVP